MTFWITTWARALVGKQPKCGKGVGMEGRDFFYGQCVGGRTRLRNHSQSWWQIGWLIWNWIESWNDKLNCSRWFEKWGYQSDMVVEMVVLFRFWGLSSRLPIRWTSGRPCEMDFTSSHPYISIQEVEVEEEIGFFIFFMPLFCWPNQLVDWPGHIFPACKGKV